MAEAIRMAEVIMSEMAKGNFSFPILVVGVAQLIVMIKRKRGEGQ